MISFPVVCRRQLSTCARSMPTACHLTLRDIRVKIVNRSTCRQSRVFKLRFIRNRTTNSGRQQTAWRNLMQFFRLFNFFGSFVFWHYTHGSSGQSHDSI